MPDQREHSVHELRNTRKGEHALVIGNSPWRAEFPLEVWGGPTIGCNAIYRDSKDGTVKGFIPQYICAIDTQMIGELVRAGMGTKTNLVVRAGETRPRIFEGMRPEDIGKWYVAGNEIDFRTLSGGMAFILAGWLGCASVTLVGFSANDTNIYLNTQHYATHVQHPKPGGVPTAMIRLYQASARFRELSDGGAIHMIAPAGFVLKSMERCQTWPD